MNKEPKPGKKLSMKTRLILILVIFVIVNLIFYLAFDGKDDSVEDKEIEQENQVTPEESNEEELFYKFNPPKP